MRRMPWAAWLLALAQAASAACMPPRDLGDGWAIEADARAAGFDATALCRVLDAFAQSQANVHSLLVERHGRLVAEAYKAGRDESIYSIFATRTEFDATTRHDLRSISKSVVSLLWGIARIGRMVLDQGRWQGRQVVPAAWLARSLVPHVATTEIGSEGYGYQWWIGRTEASGVGYEWQAGVGNGGQRLFLVPALDLAVVMTAGDYNSAAIARELGTLLTKVLEAVAPKKNPAGG